VGPSSGLDAVEERTSCPHQESNPSSMVVEPVSFYVATGLLELAQTSYF
jgi:hypothetical protein